MVESIIEFAKKEGFDAGGISEGIGRRYGFPGNWTMERWCLFII